MVIAFILLILGAYFLGSVPAAYLVAKWSRGIDIRQYGTGNVGASNVLAVVSKWWSIPVTIFDIGKGALTVWVAQLLGLGAAEQVTVGIVTIIGHNWPIFLRFRGGRGVFTTLGVVLILAPKLAMTLVIVAFACLPFGQLALGTTVTLILLPIFSWFLSQPFGIEKSLSLTLGFVALALIVLSRRLIASKTPLSKSVHPVKLIANRLLFDRDIWDRKAWISQTRTEASSVEQPPRQEEE